MTIEMSCNSTHQIDIQICTLYADVYFVFCNDVSLFSLVFHENPMTLFIGRSQATKHAYCRDLYRPRWPTQVPIPAHRNTNVPHPSLCQPVAYCPVYLSIYIDVDVKNSCVHDLLKRNPCEHPGKRI